MHTLDGNKTIYIPVRGVIQGVDVEEFLPLIEHPHFQRLRYIQQLGQVTMIYPAATHSRFVHSIGTYAETMLRQRGWRNFFSKSQDNTIRCASLLHDIGHIAFSHASERVTGHSHEENALLYLHEMKTTIEKCGVNYNRLLRLFTGEDPRFDIITNHPLGTDKFDYLFRDSINTNMDRPNLYSLDGHIYWAKNRLVIDNHLDIIRKVQRFRELYISSYGECYLRKGAAAGQRLIEKMWEYALEKDISPKQMVRFTDNDALNCFQNSTSRRCRRLYRQYVDRCLPKAVVVFRLPGCAKDEPTKDKPITVFEASRETFSRWEARYVNSQSLTKLERQLERLLQMPPDSIIITPPFHGYRFSRKPVWLIKDNQLYEIDELYPEEGRPAKILAERYTAWRIGVLNAPDRAKVNKKAALIRDLLINHD